MAETLTRRVVKATTLLSSTQGINMVCSVVRMKLLAILLGPLGVGLVGALTQVLDTISRITQLNIRTSAVRDLASTTRADEQSAIRHSVALYGRIFGVCGMMVMFVLSPWLAEFTLGTAKYAWAFRFASASLLFQALQGTHHTILQAESRYKAVAASSAFTAVAGLAITVPLYIFLRIDGIAPSIVSYAVVGWLGAMYFTRRTRRNECPAPHWKESLRQGKSFIKVGALITVMSLASDLINLGFMAYVQRAGEDTLGLFQAGYTMLWRYTGIFFIAYNLEFYPRISKVAHSPRRMQTLVTHQSMVSIAMLLPCAAAVVVLAPWLIRIFFSTEFLPATPYVTWGMAGMLCRPLSMAISLTFLAGNYSKTFCITEVISAAQAVGCNIVGFHFFGFMGLGMSTIVFNVVDLVIMFVAIRICGLQMPRLRSVAATIGAVLLLMAIAYLI